MVRCEGANHRQEKIFPGFADYFSLTAHNRLSQQALPAECAFWGLDEWICSLFYFLSPSYAQGEASERETPFPFFFRSPKEARQGD